MISMFILSFSVFVGTLCAAFVVVSVKGIREAGEEAERRFATQPIKVQSRG